jgi:type I restriction enzyme S subunit
MIQNWNYIRFGDLFDYENKSKIKAGDGLASGSYPFYTSSVELTKFIDQFQFDKTSLIFGTGGNASIHYCDNPFSVSTDCLVAIAKDETKVYPKYVFYYLFGNINLLEEGFKGAGLKHISKGYINEIQIPLPPLATQKRIAEILDAADALRRKDQELLKKYDELAQAIFIDMFGDPVKNEKGWEISKLEEVTSFIDYRGKTPERSEIEEVPLITAKNVKFGFYDFSERDFVTIEKYNEIMTRGFPKVGDVLFTTEGATLGNVCRIPQFQKFAIGQRLISMSGINVTSEYLHYFMCTDFFQEQVYKYATGSAVKGIRSAVLKKLSILVPKIEIQRAFSSAIRSIEKQKENAEISYDNSKSIFSAIIQKAFKGELVA